MLSSKSEGPDTFTRERVAELLRRETNTGELKQGFTVYTFGDPEDPDRFIQNDLTRQAMVRDEYSKWASLMEAVAPDLEALDFRLSRLLECHFRPKSNEDTIVAGACQMLTRIPETTPEFHASSVDPPYYDIDKDNFMVGSTPAWENLRAARYVSRNAIRMALQVRIALSGEYTWNNDFRNYLDTTAELLRASVQLSREKPSQEWFIVKAFLWTSWQQSMLFYHHYLLEKQLSDDYKQYQAITSPLEGPEIILSAWSSKCGFPADISSYMCRWALRLLQADKSFMGHDYRRLFQRFSHAFANSEPRCVRPSEGPPTSCNGHQPKRCLRLRGMEIKNQSAHAYGCDGNCPRLYWNEESWRSIGGTAAVLLNLGCHDRLEYCASSEQTMAVSHVWSHGQGGRPESDVANEGTGLNRCLHQRYVKIAEAHGCDSYWMDTPCIPTNHDLRREAIKYINHIFSNSKLTLICDRDLMTIDVHKPDLAVQESILATVLVCDWNVRAWTLLEALRGRKNIFILCKHDQTLSLVNTVRAVNRGGCIDIAAIFLSAQHLLPVPPESPERLGSNRVPGVTSHGRSNSMREDAIGDRRGYVSLTEATSLLSHRHASRPGDEVVIWSLLTEDHMSFDAAEFWQRQRERDKRIPAGFLISHLPRLSETDGLSWAPSRPNFPTDEDGCEDFDDLLFPYSGEGTELASITLQGLDGNWLTYEVCHAKRDPKGALDLLWVAFIQPWSQMPFNKPQPHPRRASRNFSASISSKDRKVWKCSTVIEIEDMNLPDGSSPEFKSEEFLIA